MAVDEFRRLFVYGSLLHEPSLMRTLTHRSTAPASTPFVLEGWARAWNVVSARTFALADDPSGAVHRRLVLGIIPDLGAACEGAALDLTEADLAALAPREAAYDLAEVAGGRQGAIWTYVPRVERVRAAAPIEEALVIEQAYLDDCRAGIAARELPGAAAELDRSLAGLRVATAAH